MRTKLTTTINVSLLEKLRNADIKPSEALQYGAKIMLGEAYHATKTEKILLEKVEKLAGRLTEITNRIYEFELKYPELRQKNDSTD